MQFHARSLFIVLVMQTFSLAGAIRIARVIPDPTDNAAFKHRHVNYIDQRVREDPHNMLNHEGWHLRKLLMSPAITPPFLANSTMMSIIPIATSTGSPNLGGLMPQTLGITGAYEKQNDTDDWNQQTEAACMVALSGMNGAASNPSGMAACYNVQSLNNLTGSFLAYLGIYQISAPSGNWLHTSENSVKLGLNYVQASVTRQNMTNERVSSAQERSLSSWEARDVLRPRSHHSPPRKFEGLALAGKLEILGLDMLRSSPKIAFSATMQDGSPIMTNLSLQDASFVNGLYTDQAQTRNASTARTSDVSLDTATFNSSAQRLAVFPVGLVVGSVWASLLMMTTGYGIMVRTRARNTYRRESKRVYSGGPSVISWQ
ncbi:MAG: hypothetical protein Q9217_002102 [Psora testacea]